MTYTDTDDETSIGIGDAAIKIVDGIFDGELDWEESYDTSVGITLTHQNNAVDFSRNGGDPIARLGAKIEMDDGAGYTMEVSCWVLETQSVCFRHSTFNESYTQWTDCRHERLCLS